MSGPRDYKRFLPAVNRTLIATVDGWRRSGREWWLPVQCVLCGAPGEGRMDLCGACRAELPRLGRACRLCALPLTGADVCGRCQRHPPPFVGAAAVYLYQPPLDALIKQLKFGGRLALARLLGELLAEAWTAARPASLPVDLVVPVPLHPSRLRERGFNQALELARPLARRWDVPLDWRSAARLRATVPQSDLPARLRRRNIRGAFRVDAAVAGRHVAVVDDVMTSGQTLREFAASLRRAGAVSVSVWVGARAV